MPSFHRIEELPTLAGHIVTTCGWVMTTRSSGKIGFVMLRDGTGYLQVVLSKKDVPEAAWEAFGGQAGRRFAAEYLAPGKASRAQPGQLYVEAARAPLGRVYCFGPPFRAEKPRTRGHLTGFWMSSPKWRGTTRMPTCGCRRS